MKFFLFFSYFLLIFLFSCNEKEKIVEPAELLIMSVKIDGIDILNETRPDNISLNPIFEVTFSAPIKDEFANAAFFDLSGNEAFSYAQSADKQTITISSTQSLKDLNRYLFWISHEITGINSEQLSDQLSKYIYTTTSDVPKFEEISEDSLLTLIQAQTFRYFWDFGHPASGMARERNSSGNLVTSGGSGFGIMSMIVGIERGFITREEGIARLETIISFLETADRFHGAWSHWIDGNTGKVIPFSSNDNGGDLVETAFLVQGLLAFRQYLNPTIAIEQDLINRITELWEAVEWDWYQKDGQKTLFWHWSPDKNWTMNLQISGWNESLIIYVLAASSPTHPISKEVYDNGWTRNGGMRNGRNFENILLPLGYDYGGPLFFAHYSFLGLDPRGLSDQYCEDYFLQNKNHTLINQAYCARNPRNFVGYSDENWGLTASDNHNGYSAHSPTNDLGVITPTAALSSFPYTPEESMKALKFFYYSYGDRLWGQYGFYDAFNITQGWTANSFLAIDQGPIIVMIENHRTALIWDLFMTIPEIQQGLTKLEFNF